MLTDRELQQLRNDGRDDLADKIGRLRQDLANATDPRPIGLVVQQTKALVVDRDRLRAALLVAVRQNEHDMIMTGDELRSCRAALAGLEA